MKAMAHQGLIKFMVIALFGIMACGRLEQPATESETQSTVPTMRWESLPIEYKIASTIPENLHSEIHAGFEAWNEASSTQIFRFSGIKNLQEGEIAPDYTFAENVVLTTDRSGAMQAGADASAASGPLARTFVYGVTQIRDTDIYLFEFEPNFVVGRSDTGDIYSITSVMIHEAGHMLFGDFHSLNPDSVMTPTLYPKGHPGEKVALGASDLEKLNTIYSEIL